VTSTVSGLVTVPLVRALRTTVRDVATHYVEAGSGPPLILVHGGGPGASGPSGWERLLPLLAVDHRVIALDLIGCGDTDKPLVDYSFQTLVEHLAGFIDVLGLDRVRLVGNSQGAYVAIKYALDHPGRVDAAVLLSTGTLATAVGIGDGGYAGSLPAFDGTAATMRAFLEFIVKDAALVTDELVERRLEIAMRPGHREMLASLGRYRQLVNADSSQRQVFDVRERLEHLGVPWCSIWASDDRLAPLDPFGRALQQLYPNAPFFVVDDAGHQVQTDQPDQTARLIRDFLHAQQEE